MEEIIKQECLLLTNEAKCIDAKLRRQNIQHCHKAILLIDLCFETAHNGLIQSETNTTVKSVSVNNCISSKVTCRHISQPYVVLQSF